MSAILELPELRERVARWSVDEYETLVNQGLAPKRGELIHGIIIDKMSKSPLHVDLSRWIYDEVCKHLPSGYTVFQESPLRLADSEPEPDVSVVRGIRSDFRGKHPTTATLVVEVAVSSVATDREYASMYAEAGVPEYWIILAETRQVEVRRSPQSGVYQEVSTYSVGQTLSCETLPEITISLHELFA